MHIDEHVLAGFIAGELSESDRTSVSEELIRNRGLREWLHMACAALAAADDEKLQGPLMRLIAPMNPLRPGIRRGDRHSIPSMNHVRRAI